MSSCFDTVLHVIDYHDPGKIVCNNVSIFKNKNCTLEMCIIQWYLNKHTINTWLYRHYKYYVTYNYVKQTLSTTTNIVRLTTARAPWTNVFLLFLFVSFWRYGKYVSKDMMILAGLSQCPNILFLIKSSNKQTKNREAEKQHTIKSSSHLYLPNPSFFLWT